MDLEIIGEQVAKKWSNKYFLDTEFIEGTQTIYQWGMKTDYWLRVFALFFLALALVVRHYFVLDWYSIPVIAVASTAFLFLFSLSIPKTPPTIDLISIGVVSGDDRKYYAISKDFNLKESWNRYELKYNTGMGDLNNFPPYKVYWIRENVLKPIWDELKGLYCNDGSLEDNSTFRNIEVTNFSYKSLKYLISKYGKSNKQIAEDIKAFVTHPWYWSDGLGELPSNRLADNPVSFYGYYCDFDWVVFAWLFGKMNELPDGFPFYCNDLKQELDNKINYKYLYSNQVNEEARDKTFEWWLKHIEGMKDYPKQTNEHNALSDAIFNKQLFEFLNNKL